MKDFEKLSAARRTLDRLRVPKELLAKDDCWLPPVRNDSNRSSVTSAFCGDPLPWRSALGRYEQRGGICDGVQKSSAFQDQLHRSRALPDRPRELTKFTEREREIADYIAEGESPRSVAGKLGVSYECVRAHMKHIYSKTGVHKQNELRNILLHTAAAS